MARIGEVRRLLATIAILAMAAIAVFAGYAAVHSPAASATRTTAWTNAAAASLFIFVLILKIWRRSRRSRWLLAAFLTCMGLYMLPNTWDAHSSPPSSSWLNVLRVGGILLLALAVTIIASNRIHDHVMVVADDDDTPPTW